MAVGNIGSSGVADGRVVAIRRLLQGRMVGRKHRNINREWRKSV